MTTLQLSATDTELVQSFLNGDENALQTLIVRYKDKIYTSIYMLVKDKYLAEDLFQDAFLKMICTMRQGRYADQGKFLPWASRIAHNLCMDHFRKTKRKVPVTLSTGEDLFDFMLCNETPNDTKMEERETQQSLNQLIRSLPDDQREVIVLRVYGELSFKEIAQLSNVSINTALGRMRYGLINLRKMISEQELAIR